MDRKTMDGGMNVCPYKLEGINSCMFEEGGLYCYDFEDYENCRIFQEVRTFLKKINGKNPKKN